MINQNRTKKYLLYAIGEIILVVIGILIALQINNWNENNKALVLENEYYCRLLEDFKLDEQLIVKSFNQVNQKITSGKNVLIDLHKGNKDRNTILNDYLNTLRLDVYVSNKVTFEDLKSSGNLKLISDIELKNTLLRYYSDLENILKQMNQNRDELVKRSFPDHPVAFGIHEFNYIKSTLGEGILNLLQSEDWTKDKTSAEFIEFQDNLIFILTMYERHKHHLDSLRELMKTPYELLKNNCQNNN